MKEATIEIRYPGKVISVNHYTGRTRQGGVYVKKDARLWMIELGWLIKQYHVEDWKLPLQVTCSGRFKDKRSQPDLSNLSKCTLDAFEDCTGINDVNFRWHDGTVSLDKENEPTLWITIKERG